MDDNAEQPGGGGGGENFASMSEEGEESSLPSSEVLGAVEGEGEGQTNYSKSTGTIKYSRSWKRIYIQRQIAESSWRMGKVKRVTTLVGHTAWISCLHFDENRIVHVFICHDSLSLSLSLSFSLSLSLSTRYSLTPFTFPCRSAVLGTKRSEFGRWKTMHQSLKEPCVHHGVCSVFSLMRIKSYGFTL